MEKRKFGRTNHMSTVAIFGGAAFGKISQADADQVMEMVIEAGVNHIDIAPSYGEAELRVGPWMKRERDRFFLGCKTTERTQGGAWKELQGSLARLQTERSSAPPIGKHQAARARTSRQLRSRDRGRPRQQWSDSRSRTPARAYLSPC